ncbi:hypothetical protein DdX_14804 [Ditylenchus destructor]|uniref:Uncharacterized protein n=1 Tax=Ditylenchus destructor TaxID=166010 RepID=A0AAD4MR85_9BILA|nr:hypothetical protein DdX_14804 [Ditylenchus destructor]
MKLISQTASRHPNSNYYCSSSLCPSRVFKKFAEGAEGALGELFENARGAGPATAGSFTHLAACRGLLWDILLKGFINYLIGSGFALIFLIFYLLFAICFPISGVDDDINEGVDLSIFGLSWAKGNDEKEAEMKFQEWLLFQTHRKENKTPIPKFTKEHNVNEEEEVSAIE